MNRNDLHMRALSALALAQNAIADAYNDPNLYHGEDLAYEAIMQRMELPASHTENFD